MFVIKIDERKVYKLIMKIKNKDLKDENKKIEKELNDIEKVYQNVSNKNKNLRLMKSGALKWFLQMKCKVNNSMKRFEK